VKKGNRVVAFFHFVFNCLMMLVGDVLQILLSCFGGRKALAGPLLVKWTVGRVGPSIPSGWRTDLIEMAKNAFPMNNIA